MLRYDALAGHKAMGEEMYTATTAHVERWKNKQAHT